MAQNIMETLSDRRDNLFIIGTDLSAYSPVYSCDRVHLTPKLELDDSEFYSCLKRIILEEKPDLVIPGRDGDAIVLGKLRRDFPEKADRFIAGLPDLAQIMEDKWRSYLFCKENALPFADSLAVDEDCPISQIDEFADRHGYPLVVKPRKGFASKGISLIMNRGQLHNAMSVGSVILQEYLGDPERPRAFQRQIKKSGLPLFHTLEEEKFSLQCFIGRERELKGSFVTVHKMVNGVSAGVEPYEDPSLKEILMSFYEVFASKGWYGPLNIQMQRSAKSGKFKAFELNGRYTGATAARYYLGYDEVGYSLELLGIPEGSGNGFNTQSIANKQTFIARIPLKEIRKLKLNGVWNRGSEL